MVGRQKHPQWRGRPAGALLLCLSAIAVVPAAVTPVFAYSVLTHEAVIDSVWDDSLRPALVARFPKASPEELRKAHAYAYGGVIVIDIGYYPFEVPFYSDLTHYARSGEFIKNLVADARTLDEYAFALGAIAHFPGDSNGHSLATNRSVPILYPKLRRKYGDTVTYADDERSHTQTEFGFDVLQAARGRYAPQAYHDFIGFEVCEDLLERTFVKTYGLSLDDIFDHRDFAIGSFRFAVRTLVPNATKMAWQIKKDDIVKANPGIVREKFVYEMSVKDYEKQWGTSYTHAGIGTKMLSAIIAVLPKVGPLKAYGFEPPTPEAERLYLESFDHTVADFRRLIADARRGKLELENRNFDTGKPLRLGEYVLADQTYEKWLRKLERDKFKKATPEIRRDIVAFYSTEPPAVASSATRARKAEAEASRKSIREARELLGRLEAASDPPDRLAKR